MHYGPIMIDIEGTTLSDKERALLQNPLVGGVLLFSRNCSNPAALKKLITDIRGSTHHPLLLAVDHEGGRVWRFREGFTVLPPARYYGELYAKDKESALDLIKNAGKVMASELLECGIDLSLAPVLDVDKGVSQVIGDRSYSADPSIITNLAKHFIQGMKEAGMAATGKHFPGHGGILSDTHFEQAIDHRTLQDLMSNDLLPFQELNSDLAAVMPAHVIYPNVDSVPAGFSKQWLQEILRAQLSFKGAIISDCLSMKGAAMGGDFVVRTRLALDAGCDMVIICQQERDLISWLLEKLSRNTSDAGNKRLSALAGNFSKNLKTQHLKIKAEA